MKTKKIKLKIFNADKTQYVGKIKLKRKIINLDIWERDFLFKKERKYYLEIIRKKVEKLLNKKVSCVWARESDENFILEIFCQDEEKRVILSYISNYKKKGKGEKNDATRNNKFVRTK